ncbi:hypothetical protein [Acidisphaera sp. L21]|uniref:hypothetical protein n=1 Tax=Acidisphaera sp. L21 TaxID=1641851 RepID=UPI003007D54B
MCKLIAKPGGHRGAASFRMGLGDDLPVAPEAQAAHMAATMTSGQPVCVPNTPSAASMTAALPIASLRELGFSIE